MDATLPGLLSTLTTALSSITPSLPSPSSLTPPSESISLLTTKNELLLSYLHNLVFLILLKLRHRNTESPTSSEPSIQTLNTEVVTSLVSLRIYLEKGVRPLEAKLKYQIDKVITAADEEITRIRVPVRTGSKAPSASSDDADEDDDDDDDDNAKPISSEAKATLNSKPLDELSYRPNPSSLLRPRASASTSASRPTKSSSTSAPYRPPRITATLPPTTTSASQRPSAKPQTSKALNEFLTTELSSAPLPEPSIGSNFTNHGRTARISQKERDSQIERRIYEESNFVRLPKEAKSKKRNQSSLELGGYGGEDWRGLGEGADRVGKLVNKRSKGPTGARTDVLARSRNRGS